MPNEQAWPFSTHALCNLMTWWEEGGNVNNIRIIGTDNQNVFNNYRQVSDFIKKKSIHNNVGMPTERLNANSSISLLIYLAAFPYMLLLNIHDDYEAYTRLQNVQENSKN